MKPNEYGHIDSEQFKFVQADERIFDQKLETKPIGYMKDAWFRFRKNKASIVAAVIIILLLLYAIIVPMFSKYQLSDRDLYYKKSLPKSTLLSKIGLWDGTSKSGQSEAGFDRLFGMSIETSTSYLPKTDSNGIVRDESGKVVYTDKTYGDTYSSVKKYSLRLSTDRRNNYYDVKFDSYLQVGYQYVNVSQSEFDAICAYQEKTGYQVLFPIIDTSAYFLTQNLTSSDDPNCWYYISSKGATVDNPTVEDYLGKKQMDYDFKQVYQYKTKIDKLNITDASEGKYNVEEDGRTITYNANYLTRSTSSEYSNDSYNSLRLSQDPGASDPDSPYAWVYSNWNQSGYKIRVLYYEYYRYLHGFPASFLFGSNSYGQDIFVSLAIGARFSFLLAICVSAINFVIGAVYGAIEGYYGGAIDLFMERISDILSGVPFIVVATLFQLHLVAKVGPVVSLLFAFVLTGWIGIASRVRSQFYRFKGQEYVLAARTLGASDARLIFHHIFPNSLGTIITSCILIIPGVIFSESSLSFLGIIDLHTSSLTSVGTLLSDGNAAFPNFPHIVLFPAIFISLLEISFNMFGNGLRDAFNPSLRGADE
jgi:oligopeptide transport system permease protein